MGTTTCGGVEQWTYAQILESPIYKAFIVSSSQPMLQRSLSVTMKIFDLSTLGALALGVNALATPSFHQVRSAVQDRVDSQRIEYDVIGLGDRIERRKAAIIKGGDLLLKTQDQQPGDQRHISMADLQREGWSVGTREQAVIPDDVVTALQIEGTQDCELITVVKQSSRLLSVKSIYCKSMGVIVAVDEYITDEETVRWSDITFAVWDELVTMKDPRNIHWFVEYDIDNVKTIDLLYDTFGDMPEGQVHTAARESDELKILLGNANGGGHAYFMFQHQLALTRRSFQKGLAWDGGGGKLSFATEVDPPPPPPPRMIA